jgi:hypothetical protein
LRWLEERFDAAIADGALGNGDWINPLKGLQGGNRAIYKRLVTISRGSDEESYERLARTSREELSDLTDRLRDELREIVGREIVNGEVIIDVPMKVREPAAEGEGDRGAITVPREQVLVYLQRDPLHPLPLEEASPVVGELRREFDAHAKKCRIFVHPDLFADLRPDITRARQTAAALVGISDYGETEERS